MNTQTIIASAYTAHPGKTFRALNPADNTELEGEFILSGRQQADQALRAAGLAHMELKTIGKERKSAFLRAIADNIEAITADLIERAGAESGLPQARLQGEIGRTAGQLRLFAGLVDEGSWVNAVIDRAQPDRQPLPRPDIRRMLVSIGPVVVFGASNFPLAFSVAGGDTASAFAAGCPVVVKAHPTHPGTSALVGAAIVKAVHQTNMPEGIFSLLYDSGHELGAELVSHPATRAVAFTGSLKGGTALMKLAQQREVPIPVFAEMGSVNPVILMPGALEQQAEALASKYAASITLGAGQFCTNPGLLLAVQSPHLDRFSSILARGIGSAAGATMLSQGIWENYLLQRSNALQQEGVTLLAAGKVNEQPANRSIPSLAKVSASVFLENPVLQHEIFGPYSLLVVADDISQLEQAIDSLGGQLTLTVMGQPDELPEYAGLLNKIGEKAGRLIMNGVPTGVEVCAAMQHGGPYPASSDSRFTSVGTAAIYRFARPLTWQDWPDQLLPDELKDKNPLNIFRLIDQQWTKDS